MALCFRQSLFVFQQVTQLSCFILFQKKNFLVSSFFKKKKVVLDSACSQMRKIELITVVCNSVYPRSASIGEVYV
jgi:hypothetical protein